MSQSNANNVCAEIREELKKLRFDITYDREDKEECLINFRYAPSFEKAKQKFGEDDALFIATSTVSYDKKKKVVGTNLLSPLEKFCELYLDYCCEDNVNVCRIHVDPEYPRVGLEVKPINLEKFKEALADFFNCTR